MKKVFIFNQSVMNGTVTIGTGTALFSSRDLAEKTREAVMEVNKEPSGPFAMYCGEIMEAEIFETEEEVPILNRE